MAKIEVEIDREILDKLDLEPVWDFKVTFPSSRQKCNRNFVAVMCNMDRSPCRSGEG